MSDEIRNAMWCGERIGDMPREQLFEIIAHLSAKLKEYTSPAMSRAIALGKVNQIMRGEIT